MLFAGTLNTALVMISIGTGTCTDSSHEDPIPMSGIIITGMSGMSADSGAIAGMLSIVLGNCGHVGIIVTGSSSVTGGGLARALIGAQFTGAFTGIIVTGATTQFTAI
jgi:hypothetical protein